MNVLIKLVTCPRPRRQEEVRLFTLKDNSAAAIFFKLRDDLSNVCAPFL